ncbi:MAG TPA: YcaO-like family protein [Amycolatopsis sp.]|uniref:YcaO-like family protein n=1 Tax=Amycolatopsis sp. TaxID=37632 RepID=UPI002B45D646|nr:YcaO-like family protein [Amycolatopsis sp.]HKS46406.1 YcaO-like family protein [Amycolatopsis sp.]
MLGTDTPDPIGGSESTPSSDVKVFFTGTHRVRRPEQTWALIAPMLEKFGITRIADVTGLDTLGVPVAMAVRPLAKSLSVSQGKGRTKLLAKISAAMEAIELWHAENTKKAITYPQTPGRALNLPYRIGDLASGPDALVTDTILLDWGECVGMLSGRAVPVPSELVALNGHDKRRWSPAGLKWSSNGLASGNSRKEASLHALYEVVERDALSRQPRSASPEYVDPASIADVACSSLVKSIMATGASLTINRLTNRFGVPCFGAKVWSTDFPVVCLGWGAHLDPHVAVSRAITEAAQSRLTAITGSRDDLPPIYRPGHWEVSNFTPRQGTVVPWDELAAEGPTPSVDLGAELDWICQRVQQVTGTEPLLADLSTATEFAVVKVIVPGAALDGERVHPRL